jgi:hypothetical protein
VRLTFERLLRLTTNPAFFSLFKNRGLCYVVCLQLVVPDKELEEPQNTHGGQKFLMQASKHTGVNRMGLIEDC